MGFNNPFGRNYVRRKGASIITPPGGGTGGGGTGGGGTGGGGGGETTGDWFPGIYLKTNASDLNTASSANHVWTPYPYDPSDSNTAHKNSLFGKLDRKKWFRGLTILASWNKIETSQGAYNTDWLDKIFDTVAGLQRANGQNKKIILYLKFRTFDIGAPDSILPNYLMTQSVTTNGGNYKDPVLYPLGQNPPVNAKRYDNCWAYEGYYDSAPTVLKVKGYNFACYKFVGAGTNTLKTRFTEFIDFLASKYLNHPAFGGIHPTESSIGTPFVSYYDGNSRNAHYTGRFEMMKIMRSKFPGKLVAEAINADNQYYHDLSDAGVTDGLIANRIAFTTPDCHLGTNMNVENARTVLAGKLPIVHQIQPLMMKSRTGNRPTYWDWPNNPTVRLNGDGILNNDPTPSAPWIIQRAQYLKSTHFIYQHMIESDPALIDWPAFETWMDSSIYANDPAGGMISTRPQFPS